MILYIIYILYKINFNLFFTERVKNNENLQKSPFLSKKIII
jgi:hypothetical protein